MKTRPPVLYYEEASDANGERRGGFMTGVKRRKI